MKTLRTWAGKSQFQYSGSVTTGTMIKFGQGFQFTIRIPAAAYSQVLERFGGQTLKIGTSRDTPPRGSLGDWLREHVTKTAIASYVGPILIEEGYAEKGSESDEIHIKPDRARSSGE